jgi:hypothetical protein
MFSGASGSGFGRIHLLEHRYRGGLTTLKTRDPFVRRKAIAVLVWMMRLYGRWGPISVEVQGNLCGMEAVSYGCLKRLRGKFCANGFAWNLTYNAALPNRWIGRARTADVEWMKWPPHSPNLTPYDFLLWDYIKEQEFVPLLPQITDEVKLRITQLSRKLTGTS